MQVLVQTIDRYGRVPVQTYTAFLNDGPDTFKGEDGNVDKNTLMDVLYQAFDDFNEEDVEHLMEQRCVMSKDGNTVHFPSEEADIVITNATAFFED